jgi:hypothetical protein
MNKTKHGVEKMAHHLRATPILAGILTKTFLSLTLIWTFGSSIALADILVAFRGEDSDQRIWISKMRSDFHWEAAHTATGGTNPGPALIRMIGGTYMLVARGIDNDSILYWQTSGDGINWTFRRAMPTGAGTGAGPHLFYSGNDLSVMFRGEHQNIPIFPVDDIEIYSETWDGNGNWTNLSQFAGGGHVTSETPGAARDDQGRMFAVWKAPDRASNPNEINAAWGTRQGFDRSFVVDGLTSGAPAVLAIGTDTFLVAIKGDTNPSDTIYWRIFQYGRTPDPWKQIGGTGTTHGPALAQDRSGIYLVWKGVDGDHGLYFSRFTGSGWLSPRSNGVQDTVDCNCGTSARPSLAGDSPLRLPPQRD